MLFFLEAAQKALTGCRDFLNGIIAQAPKEMGKEVEACLEREIAGDAARVVRGDGTVDENASINDLSELSPSNGHKRDGSSSPESGSSSEVEPSWEKASPSTAHQEQSPQDPHIRDGTSVASNDGDMEEQESHISLRPKRRSPKHSDAASQPAPATITLLQPKPKNVPSKASSTDMDTQNHNGNFNEFNNTNGINHSEYLTTTNATNTTNTTNNNGPTQGLSRRQTYVQLSHANSPTSPPSAMQMPSLVPSVRRRARATSHPDVFKLCQSWAELGPANEAVHIDASSQSQSKRGT
jgi:hypothetical protein